MAFHSLVAIHVSWTGIGMHRVILSRDRSYETGHDGVLHTGCRRRAVYMTEHRSRISVCVTMIYDCIRSNGNAVRRGPSPKTKRTDGSRQPRPPSVERRGTNETRRRRRGRACGGAVWGGRQKACQQRKRVTHTYRTPLVHPCTNKTTRHGITCKHCTYVWLETFVSFGRLCGRAVARGACIAVGARACIAVLS
jgi:hypothetical protein